MAALPKATYGIHNLYLFPYYQTRDQYLNATGKEAPEFDPTRPPKFWADPSTVETSPGRRNIVYENVIAYNERGLPIAGPDGKPMLESMALLKIDAASVNIPKKLAANEPGTDVPEIPPPMRSLHPDEYLDFDFGGIVVVRNRNFDNQKPATFSIEDRELLRAIARKLGVTI